MPFQQRNTIASMGVGFLVMTLLGWRLAALGRAGRFDGAESLALWAQTVLIAVLLGILATILSTILANILWAIVTREPKPSFVTDERDRIFEIRAMRVTGIIAGIGFVIALILLATGYSAVLALSFIFYGFAGGDFLGNAYRLWLYRDGGA